MEVSTSLGSTMEAPKTILMAVHTRQATSSPLLARNPLLSTTHPMEQVEIVTLLSAQEVSRGNISKATLISRDL
jgi:hypothetical protein